MNTRLLAADLSAHTARRLEAWRTFIERTVPAHAPSERYLQDAIDEKLRPQVLTARHPGRRLRREFELSATDRIDFLIQEPNPIQPPIGGPGVRASIGIGLEVKVDGPLSALVRQLQRYAQHDAVDALLVVTTRARLHAVPTTLSGKPIAVALLLTGGL